MAQKRKAAPPKARRKAAPPKALERGDTDRTATETSQEAITRIAQDAVVILRRELAFRAEVSLMEPGGVSMADCIALLRLTTELGAAARQGEDGQVQHADYTRLLPHERVQLAALLLKVDYA